MTTTTTTTEQSNSLKFNKVTTDKDGNTLIINIRLDDQCKNGHQDFAITGTLYEKGKPKTDRYMIRGGAMGDYIAAEHPEFAIFERLHLCDFNGVPMHPTANMHYFLRVGFNNTKRNDPKFPTEFCEYYRMNMAQFEAIKDAHNEIDLSILLQSTGVLKQWKDEANEAILLLENLTGKKFVNDSKKSQLVLPSEEAIKEEEEKVKSGYYTPEAMKERQDAESKKKIEELEQEREKELNKVNLEYNAKKAVLVYGLPVNNFIFYSHTLEGCFNWKSYEKQITPEELEQFLNSETYAQLCPGVKFYLNTKK